MIYFRRDLIKEGARECMRTLFDAPEGGQKIRGAHRSLCLTPDADTMIASFYERMLAKSIDADESVGPRGGRQTKLTWPLYRDASQRVPSCDDAVFLGEFLDILILERFGPKREEAFPLLGISPHTPFEIADVLLRQLEQMIVGQFSAYFRYGKRIPEFESELAGLRPDTQARHRYGATAACQRGRSRGHQCFMSEIRYAHAA
jgi:hypothetical protein